MNHETQDFKAGDRIEYVGPPRNTIYQHILDHPDSYTDWKIDYISRPADTLLGIPVFVKTSCKNQHGESCGGYRFLRPGEWRKKS